MWASLFLLCALCFASDVKMFKKCSEQLEELQRLPYTKPPNEKYIYKFLDTTFFCKGVKKFIDEHPENYEAEKAEKILSFYSESLEILESFLPVALQAIFEDFKVTRKDVVKMCDIEEWGRLGVSYKKYLEKGNVKELRSTVKFFPYPEFLPEHFFTVFDETVSECINLLAKEKRNVNYFEDDKVDFEGLERWKKLVETCFKASSTAKYFNNPQYFEIQEHFKNSATSLLNIQRIDELILKEFPDIHSDNEDKVLFFASADHDSESGIVGEKYFNVILRISVEYYKALKEQSFGNLKHFIAGMPSRIQNSLPTAVRSLFDSSKIGDETKKMSAKESEKECVTLFTSFPDSFLQMDSYTLQDMKDHVPALDEIVNVCHAAYKNLVAHEGETDAVEDIFGKIAGMNTKLINNLAGIIEDENISSMILKRWSQESHDENDQLILSVVYSFPWIMLLLSYAHALTGDSEARKDLKHQVDSFPYPDFLLAKFRYSNLSLNLEKDFNALKQQMDKTHELEFKLRIIEIANAYKHQLQDEIELLPEEKSLLSQKRLESLEKELKVSIRAELEQLNNEFVSKQVLNLEKLESGIERETAFSALFKLTHTIEQLKLIDLSDDSKHSELVKEVEQALEAFPEFEEIVPENLLHPVPAIIPSTPILEDEENEDTDSLDYALRLEKNQIGLFVDWFKTSTHKWTLEEFKRLKFAPTEEWRKSFNKYSDWFEVQACRVIAQHDPYKKKNEKPLYRMDSSKCIECAKIEQFCMEDNSTMLEANLRIVFGLLCFWLYFILKDRQSVRVL